MRRLLLICLSTTFVLSFASCNRTPPKPASSSISVHKQLDGHVFSTVDVYTVDPRHDARQLPPKVDSAQRTVGP